MNYEIIQDRLNKVLGLTLDSGSHDGIEEGLCVMEATAYIAGEEWSDHPECACPIIAAFLRAWNDGLPENERNALLKPLVPLLVGTRSTKEIEQRRATMAADWLIRVHTPAWLRLAKLEDQAKALESLPEITDFAQCPSLMPTLEAVKRDAAAAWAAAGDAAWAAAWAAAGDAAWAAAGDAAWDAAWAAAGDAARAAAGAAARDAAWDAAGAAARDAAWDALSKTKTELQQSALALVNRMIDLKAAP